MSLLFPSAQAPPGDGCCAELFQSVFPLGHQAGQAWVQTVPEQPGEPLLCPEPAQPPWEPLWSCGGSGKGLAPLAFGTDPWLLRGAGGGVPGRCLQGSVSDPGREQQVDVGRDGPVSWGWLCAPGALQQLCSSNSTGLKKVTAVGRGSARVS